MTGQLNLQLLDLDGFAPAEFSPCRRWRYILVRRWSEAPMLGCIGLNPSKADELDDDPTVRRWCGFARRDGFGGIVVGNLFAWRSTNPRELLVADDPVGEDNDSAIERIATVCQTVLVSWGSMPSKKLEWRTEDVLALLSKRHVRIVHLGMTSGGQPRHPLYLRGDEPMRAWAGVARS